jgi:pteridine reductase
MELLDSVALVTGGARRVGRAIALALADEGCDVALHYHSSADDATATAEAVAARGVRCKLLRADLADPDAIARMFADLAADWDNRLDLLVNNAAIYQRTPWEELTAEQFDRQMAVNARAPALCIRHALDLLPAGGAVVNVADVSADRPWGGFGAYCASKAALLAITRSAAKALGPKGIRVNAVSPGVAEWSDIADEQRKASVLKQIPMGRPGSPRDVAEAVVFLARQDYITGQNIRVDGGWVM